MRRLCLGDDWSGTTVPYARLDVGIWSVSEGATQQQSGGIVLPTSPSAWSILEARIELHQYENLRKKNQRSLKSTPR